MLTLYIKTGCPFCSRVLDKLQELGIPFEEKNISDPDIAKELIEKGGKRQVPYVEDDDPCTTAGHHTPCLTDDDVAMYESAEIVAYLDENYAKTDTPSPTDTTKSSQNIHLHRDDGSDVCESCQ